MQYLRFSGGEYKKCRLLRYKNRVRTSQETRSPILVTLKMEALISSEA
jgi:hypothetical protein